MKRKNSLDLLEANKQDNQGNPRPFRSENDPKNNKPKQNKKQQRERQSGKRKKPIFSRIDKRYKANKKIKKDYAKIYDNENSPKKRSCFIQHN